VKVESIQVSIIIVNYNTDELTQKAVESIFEYTDNLNFEIIVVDNNSKETKLADTLSKCKNTYFYKLDKNIGFGKANNFGYEMSQGKYIFLLNSDAYLINKNTISTFIDYLENQDNVAIVGGNLITEDLLPNICHGKFLSVERILYDYELKKVNQEYFMENLATARHCYFDDATPVDHLTGAAIMIKREVIEKYGLFDPRYFMYLEDMDLCFRYKKKGYLSVLIPQTKIVHLGGQSRVNDLKIQSKINKEIQYSKYLFLLNVSNWYIAYFLFVLGKFLPIIKRIKTKIKGYVKW
jgi:GT2 family glycosyltransferase